MGRAMWGRDITAQALVIIEAVLAAMDGRIKLLVRCAVFLCNSHLPYLQNSYELRLDGATDC
jgi:hypothetical protein